MDVRRRRNTNSGSGQLVGRVSSVHTTSSALSVPLGSGQASGKAGRREGGILRKGRTHPSGVRGVAEKFKLIIDSPAYTPPVPLRPTGHHRVNK